MMVRDEHLSSPNTCHGGVLAGLMDAALGAAALSLTFTTGELVATIEFKMNYLYPVHLHDAPLAKAQVEHTGNKLVMSSCAVYLVAAGSGKRSCGSWLGHVQPPPS